MDQEGNRNMVYLKVAEFIGEAISLVSKRTCRSASALLDGIDDGHTVSVLREGSIRIHVERNGQIIRIDVHGLP